MAHTPFKIGQIVTNTELSNAYEVSPQGGMRKSNTYQCLVLISDRTNIYDDKWHGEVLHYTGMGQIGDQQLIRQNKNLYYSKRDNLEVHLFEVVTQRHYTYRGIVELADSPYQDTQADKNGNLRRVWIFPLILISGAPEYTADELDTIHKDKQNQAKKMSVSELELAAKKRANKEPAICRVTSKHVERDEVIAEYTKMRANGICQLCNQPAPFKDKQGNPYLESHHIIWLSKGGEDTVENCVALCPNCHKKMHIINDINDIIKLKDKNTSL